MKILITGISGFVARHYLDLLESEGANVTVLGIYNDHLPDFDPDDFNNINCQLVRLNLMDRPKVKELIAEFKPDQLLHLASRSSVANSWRKPGETIIENSQIFINIIECLRELSSPCRMLSVGSAEEYGNVNGAQLPLKESYCISPVSPYGAARVLQNNLVGMYAKNYCLNLIHTRSFNHIGPYQHENFVISSFIKQICEQMNAGARKINLVTGDLDVIRDFTDVRDVVKAYYALLKKGKKGETYNVCSNTGYQLRKIVELFSGMTHIPISCKVDHNNFRPSENKELVGCYEKLFLQTGWKPEIPIEQSLTDLLIYWKQKIAVLS